MKLWYQKIREQMQQYLLKILPGSTDVKDNEVGFFLPNRHISWVCSFVLGLLFFTFLVGYFYGQRKAIERFVSKIEEESFADRISYALYTMNDRESSEFEESDADTDAPADVAVESSNNVDNVTENSDEDQNVSEEITTQDEVAHEIDKDNKNVTTGLMAEEKNGTEAAEVIVMYSAEIMGFGSAQAAHRFIDRVEELDSRIHLKKRISKTSKGKKIVWYQAVAQDFENKEELEKLLDEIKKKENIKEDIIISAKRKVVNS